MSLSSNNIQNSFTRNYQLKINPSKAANGKALSALFAPGKNGFFSHSYSAKQLTSCGILENL
jgi:hypothetical protein